MICILKLFHIWSEPGLNIQCQPDCPRLRVRAFVQRVKQNDKPIAKKSLKRALMTFNQRPGVAVKGIQSTSNNSRLIRVGESCETTQVGKQHHNFSTLRSKQLSFVSGGDN